MAENKFTQRIMQERVAPHPVSKPFGEPQKLPVPPMHARPCYTTRPLRVKDYFVIDADFNWREKRQISIALERILSLPEIQDQLFQANKLRDRLPDGDIKKCLSSKIHIHPVFAAQMGDSAHINTKHHRRSIGLNVMVRHTNYLTRDGRQAPFTLESTLAHELFHLLDPALMVERYGFHKFSQHFKEDIGAVMMENSVNKSFLRPARSDYVMKDLPVERGFHNKIEKRMWGSDLGEPVGNWAERKALNFLARNIAIRRMIPQNIKHLKSYFSLQPWDSTGPLKSTPVPFHIMQLDRMIIANELVRSEWAWHDYRKETALTDENGFPRKWEDRVDPPMPEKPNYPCV